MQSTEESDNFQRQVLESLDRLTTNLGQLSTDVEQLSTDVEQLSTDVEQLSTDVEQLKQELALTNTRVDTYQKASNQVVNLAFGLIATATITIIITTVTR
ncbi:hypothetical protein J5X98_00250 [Leptothermofonsia sichuanensis E412]|uniref:LPP leucine zipper domain-containing protein n=1 Tax=Leptothermofonsia sichuanensis TaxID=2917832 RepID=UPI001CA6327F|nr:LPP leucine zipper domain-containing protein [Leptothermofonsia sichuanensis]QZZ20985.1 hypothetical protein J5X98_00250 [Leptothermofonsia sichuanensis E412]